MVGGYLLLFARHQPLKVLVDTSFVHTNGSYWPAFLASSLAAMFCYYGFEACGDVAEETPDASRMIPKAMRMTIYIGGAAATWVCLAFVLSIPDIGAVMSGADKDPIVTLLRSAMGEAGFRAVIVVVLVSFISCLLSLQAAASRLIFAYARDQMIFGSKYLSRMSPGHHVPATALIVMGAIPAVIALSALWLQDAIATIISFAAIGIYISFQMIVLAALIARIKGWRPSGPFTLGAWGWCVNLIALAYGVERHHQHPVAPQSERSLVRQLFHAGDHGRRRGAGRDLHDCRKALRTRQRARGRCASVGSGGKTNLRAIRGRVLLWRHCRRRRSNWCP